MNQFTDPKFTMTIRIAKKAGQKGALMTFFENLQTRIAALDEKTWYKYLAITAGILFTYDGLILFFYFSSVSKWEEELTEINESAH